MKHLFLLMLMFITTIGISQTMRIRTNLYVIGGALPGENLYDGVASEYTPNGCNCIDANDVWKLGGDGWRPTLGILRNNIQFVVERRDTVNVTDTTYFKIRNISGNNMIMMKVENVYPANLSVLLFDKYLNTQTNVSILGDTFRYYFTVDSNPLSWDTFRFKMVLTNPPGFIAPPIYTEFKVYPNPIMRGQTLHIESPNNSNEYYLISSTGIKYKVSATNNTIQLPNLISGMYLLYDPKSKEKKKIVVL